MLSKAIAPLLLSTAAAITVTVGKQSSSNGCDALSKSVPNTIFYRGDDVYKYENTQFWSNNELMDPECVFRPSSADEVAQAVQIMQDTNTQFAVRGGGHMAIRVCAFSYTYASTWYTVTACGRILQTCRLVQTAIVCEVIRWRPDMDTMFRKTRRHKANESCTGLQQHR
jgi:hypothetical protein